MILEWMCLDLGFREMHLRLKKYLSNIQNSVFKGEISDAMFMKVELEVRSIHWLFLSLGMRGGCGRFFWGRMKGLRLGGEDKIYRMGE